MKMLKRFTNFAKRFTDFAKRFTDFDKRFTNFAKFSEILSNVFQVLVLQDKAK